MIGAVLAGGMGAAQADITVFGHLDTAVRNVDQDEGWRDTSKNPGKTGEASRGWLTSDGGESKIDDTTFRCTTCSIGFKGSEDLGNGLSVIFKLDFQFDMFKRNKDKDTFRDRDQWLGFKGNFGQVRWGTISTGYKSHGAMLDPIYRTTGQGRENGLQSYLHTGANEEGGGRSEQTVRWDSPNWNGLKVTAWYTLDSTETDGVNRDGLTNPKLEEDDDPYGIGAQYTNGGILVFADYLTNDSNDNTNGVGDLTAWKVVGKYKVNNFAFMGQYENIEQNMWDGTHTDSYTSGKQEGTWWYVGGTYTMGNNMVYLAYGQNDWDNIDNYVSTPNDLEATAITLAGTHKLSKRTTIYATYTAQTQDADTPVNESRGCNQTTGVNCGEVDRDQFAIGMKHKF